MDGGNPVTGHRRLEKWVMLMGGGGKCANRGFLPIHFPKGKIELNKNILSFYT